MSGTRAEIERARADAEAARFRLQETAALLKDRINPAIRAREAWGDVRNRGETIADDALEFTYERPAVVAGAAAGIVALLLRRPIARLACRLVRRRRPKWDTPDAGADVARAAGSRGDRR